MKESEIDERMMPYMKTIEDLVRPDDASDETEGVEEAQTSRKVPTPQST
jgi:hypothetical protein